MKRLTLFFVLLLSLSCFATELTVGTWRVNMADATGIANVYKNGQLLLSHNKSVVYLSGTQYSLSDMSVVSVDTATVADDFGSGKSLTLTALLNDSVTVIHTYYLYDNLDYMLTRVTMQSAQIIRSNYIAPVATTSPISFSGTAGNRALFVPFDNDEWIRYKSHDFGSTVRSYEVGAIYNTETNEGLILGSIEHTDWKTKVKYTTTTPNQINTITAYGGASDNITRDNLPHGSLVGHTIQSPLMFVGYFDDWRTGLETFGDANVIVAPKMPWNNGKPFVWNSWGVLQTDIRYMNATQSAKYIADSLMSRGYQNNGVMYMDLDSYWDNMQGGDLRRFSAYCNERNQISGIYWTPFVDWANNPERIVEGTTDVKYKDIWLYANGQPIKRTGATACDPTHPGTKARMRHFMGNFHYWGYEFLKLDFMDHGILEADSWYDTTVHTGVQAYCQGMAYLDSLADGKMYLNLSIAPLFPAHFAHGRRIACDAYGSVGNSEYTLNSTTYGWWLDHVYHYNDPDNIVLKGYSESINRIRISSALVTGMLCIGDDYSLSGNTTAKERAKVLLTVPDLLQMARETKSFRPHIHASGDAATTQYYTTCNDTVFLALFNFGGRKQKIKVSPASVGLNTGEQYVVKEMWEAAYEYQTDELSWIVPAQDVRILKIYQGTIPEETAVETIAENTFSCAPNPADTFIQLSLPEVDDVLVYAADGRLMARYFDTLTLPIEQLTAGNYIVRAASNGAIYTSQFMKK